MTEDTANTSNQQFVFELLRSMTGQSNILTIPRHFITLFGDRDAALFFSQCLFWSDKGSNQDGWIHKTAEEWLEETTLSYYLLTKFFGQFTSLGLLETKVQKYKNAPTLHFRVKRKALVEFLLEYFKKDEDEARALVEDAQEAAKKPARRQKRAEKKASAADDQQALAPQNEASYILFNRLADEYTAKGRRPPVRFGSITQRTRFEAAAELLGDKYDKALNDALSVPLLSLQKLVLYLEKCAANKDKPASQPAADQSALLPAPASAAVYSSGLEERRAAAREALEKARQNQPARAAPAA